jgi:hypothetical protein
MRFSRETLVADVLSNCPPERIKVNAIERDALHADSDREHLRPYFSVEAVLVHAEVTRCVAQAQKPRGQRERESRFRHGRCIRVRLRLLAGELSRRDTVHEGREEGAGSFAGRFAVLGR